MSITDRQKEILSIVDERTYITVRELAKLTSTSPSSIRRDLTALENSGRVTRLHGGVTTPAPIKGVAGFNDRINKNTKQKRIIAKKASALLCNGMSIMLDSSTTAMFMLPYIAKLQSATLFTNNLQTALRGVELGIDTHCLGGRSVNSSAALAGPLTRDAIAGISPDILFFSSQSLDKNGNISDSTEEENHLRQLMIKAAKRTVFLCDSDKFGQASLYRLATLDDIDTAVFDREYDGLCTKCDII